MSLPPGTIPAGRVVTIRRVGDAGALWAGMRNGGLDPVPVGAQSGDSIEVAVKDGNGTTIQVFTVAVLAARPPIIVRTNPPRRKTDVPVNTFVVVTFSEPVAGASLGSSIQLFRGAIPVAGSVRLLEGTAAAAVFTPAAPLDANADYQLRVTDGVRDLSGRALEEGETVEFSTGQATTGAIASLDLSPDTVYMTTSTYPMTATVEDPAGNPVTDQPITWSTNEPAALTVSDSGLMTALVEGVYNVSAAVGGLEQSAMVVVSFGAPPGSVDIAPPTAATAVGDTVILTATLRDAAGHRLINRQVTWTSGDSTVAIVDTAGTGPLGEYFATVTGVSAGTVRITATSGTASGTTSITVGPPQPVASVSVTPESAALVLQQKVHLTATLRDANGRVLFLRPIAWATDNAAVVTVDANGLVSAVGAGSAAVIATSEEVSDTAAIAVTTISFTSVVTSPGSTCGPTTTGAVYCWGWGFAAYLFGDSLPVAVPVAGDLAFVTVTLGDSHACGLTASGTAYCWGVGERGQLGNGSHENTFFPMPVSGGLTFVSLSAGWQHTCGLTPTGVAYCWGDNEYGQLGVNTAGPPSLVPVAVMGARRWSLLTAGDRQTCGLTTSGTIGAAYCWGANFEGQLGTGAPTNGTYPFPGAVSGGLVFSSLSTGVSHSCGVTTSGAAYCWGSNDLGQLGDSSQNASLVPVAVAGGITFASVGTDSHHGRHTCGIATTGAAYCWGLNASGQLGNGSGGIGSTDIFSLVPVPVSGGLTFSSVNTGDLHTCGMSTSGIAYCWGYGLSLGRGSTTDSNVPVKVAGQP